MKFHSFDRILLSLFDQPRFFCTLKRKKKAFTTNCTGGSVSWASGWHAGGCEFDSGRTNTQGLKITEYRKCCLCNYISKWLDFQVFSDEDYKPQVPSHNTCHLYKFNVKEPTHYSKRVGREVSRCCGCPLCCSFWVGASHRDNLMHLSPLDRIVQEKWLCMLSLRKCAQKKIDTN